MTRQPAAPGVLRLAAFAVFISLTTSACLPRGDAPAGRQILPDKTAVLLGILPPNGDGMVRVTFFRPGKDAQTFNLWVVAVDPNGGPSSERMLFTDIDDGYVLGDRPSVTSGGGFPTDAQGRLYWSTFAPSDSPDQPFMEKTLRADPVTGEVVDIGQPNVTSSPSFAQFIVSYNSSGAPLTFDQNGGVVVPDVATYALLGNTAFYLTVDGTLVRLDMGGASQQLATGVATFFPFTAQKVLITRAVPDPDMTEPPPPTNPFGGPPSPPTRVTGALIDTTTLVETPLPDGPLYQYASQPSPSGRYFVVSQPSQDPSTPTPDPLSPYGGDRVLLDTVNGTFEALDPAFQYSSGWRPGHDELWATSVDDPNQTGLLSTATLSIKKPGQPVLTVPGVDFTRFSDDGAYWFSRGAPLSMQDSSDLVGLADDPAGPRVRAVPAGSSLENSWTLGDGRLLDDSSVGLDSFENDYIQIVDPRNGATQLLGELGYLSAVGQTRALGLYHVSYLRGDLTTSDFATGRSTVLAAEFAMSAVAEPQGTDGFPPGGRIVYQFDARFDSPWDGLWMATVP